MIPSRSHNLKQGSTERREAADILRLWRLRLTSHRRCVRQVLAAIAHPSPVGSISVPPVFNSARKRDRPLSRYLQSALTDSQLPNNLQSCKTLDQLDEFEKALPAALDALRPQLPELGKPKFEREDEHGGVWSPIPETGASESTTRFWIAVRVHGDPNLLTCWPDDSNEELVPVDAAMQEEAENWESAPSRTEQDRLRAAEDTWQLSQTGSTDPDEFALYTFIDLTIDQEEAVASGRLKLRAVIDDRLAQAQRIVTQITQQTSHYFDYTLRRQFQDTIEQRRTILTRRAGVIDRLGFPRNWSVTEPRLQSLKPAGDETATAPGENNAVVHESAAASVGSDAVSIDARPRLDPASFEDVQAVIRVWADSIERYPEAFHLPEDRVSDLLAATLNATLPGANREVYSRGGKSDIFIQADTLSAGKGPAKVFICESKWADDNPVVKSAVDPQLFGYLTSHDTAAVLLLLLDTQSFDKPKNDRLAALREVVGYQSETEGPSGWPIFEYLHEDRLVELCVATVHVPKKLDSTAKTGKRRRSPDRHRNP